MVINPLWDSAHTNNYSSFLYNSITHSHFLHLAETKCRYISDILLFILCVCVCVWESVCVCVCVCVCICLFVFTNDTSIRNMSYLCVQVGTVSADRTPHTTDLITLPVGHWHECTLINSECRQDTTYHQPDYTTCGSLAWVYTHQQWVQTGHHIPPTWLHYL